MTGLPNRMQELIFIGTLHGGLTPSGELTAMLKELQPNQILVEIDQDDLESDTLKAYPQEMVAVSRWARGQGIPATGFEAKMNVKKSGVTDADEERLWQEQGDIIRRHDWKDFNKKENDGILDTESWSSIVDQKKWDDREAQMRENILKGAKKEGRTVVVTGSGHIPFFVEAFPHARFPLR